MCGIYSKFIQIWSVLTPYSKYISIHVFVVIIIIIIRHQLDPDRPVSTSSNSLFKGLPSPLRPFGL